MAYINGEYKHPNYEIEVQVLEPTKGEMTYSEGRKININWDSMLDISTGELARIIRWFQQVKNHIAYNFDRKGRKKDSYTEFEYKP